MKKNPLKSACKSEAFHSPCRIHSFIIVCKIIHFITIRFDFMKRSIRIHFEPEMFAFQSFEKIPKVTKITRLTYFLFFFFHVSAANNKRVLKFAIEKAWDSWNFLSKARDKSRWYCARPFDFHDEFSYFQDSWKQFHFGELSTVINGSSAHFAWKQKRKSNILMSFRVIRFIHERFSEGKSPCLGELWCFGWRRRVYFACFVCSVAVSRPLLSLWIIKIYCSQVYINGNQRGRENLINSGRLSFSFM